MQDQIFDLLLKEEEISWKTIIFELVKNEQMDPWDIDISLLTQKYLGAVKVMQEHDLKISGKVLLAAAILLKMKSTHLLDKDITRLDALLNQDEAVPEEDLLLDDDTHHEKKEKQQFTLIPRNPQPRNRKVSIHDLVNALQQAMATKKRMLERLRPVQFNLPERKVDIVEVIHDVYHKIVYYSQKNEKEKITFSKLLPPRAGRYEKAYTFIPLLHLENQQKIEMEQEKPFAEIHVGLASKKKQEEE
ncbi:segregation/condensation protein A [Candidatus Woesearchaeota archaeon]|nr:segregation/condensation protein A [Candidatus Woesearchaeota archaeon]